MIIINILPIRKNIYDNHKYSSYCTLLHQNQYYSVLARSALFAHTHTHTHTHTHQGVLTPVFQHNIGACVYSSQPVDTVAHYSMQPKDTLAHTIYIYNIYIYIYIYIYKHCCRAQQYTLNSSNSPQIFLLLFDHIIGRLSRGSQISMTTSFAQISSSLVESCLHCFRY